MTMPTNRLQRLLPLSGALFALVIAAGLAVSSGEPDANAPKQQIYAYWRDNHGIQLVNALLLIPCGAALLLVFSGELRRTLRSGEAGEAVYSPLALAGGIVTAVGLAISGSLVAAVTTAAHDGSFQATYTLAQLQSYDWMPWMLGFAVLLLASGIGGLRKRTLPKPLALTATILGVAFLTPIGYFALLALPLWMLATSVTLYRGPTTRHSTRASVARTA
jgi:hypothetical protein